MAYFGCPFGSPFGDNDNFFSQLTVQNAGGGLVVRGTPLYGMDCWYQFILDNLKQGPPQFIQGGNPAQFKGVFTDSGVQHDWSIFCQGGFSSTTIDPSVQLAIFASGRATRLIANISTIPRIFSYGDNEQFSNWNLIGATRFQNTAPVPNNPTWGALDVYLTTGSTGHIITLTLNNVIQAQGTIEGNGTVIISDQGGGISGTVTLTYTADIPSLPATLIHDWPTQLRIYYQTEPYIDISSFPSKPQATINDNGTNIYIFRSPAVAPGTYYVVVHQVDENGNESTGIQGGGIPMVIDTLPTAPGAVSYVGVNSEGTEINVILGELSSSPYYLNIYDSTNTGLLDMTQYTQIEVTEAEENTAGAVSLIIPNIPGYTGNRYLLVRAAVEGVESANSNVFTIEYINGDALLSSPNIPSLTGTALSKSGLNFSVPISLNIANQAVAAEQVLLYLFPNGASPDSSFHFSTTLKRQDPTKKTGNIAYGVITGTASSPGLYQFILRSVGANGQESEASPIYGPIELTLEAPIDPVIEGFAGF